MVARNNCCNQASSRSIRPLPRGFECSGDLTPYGGGSMTTYSRSRSLRQRFWCLIRPEGPSRGRRGSISRNPAPCAVCIRHPVRKVRALGTVFCSGSAPLCRNLVELYGSFPHLAMALQICCSHKLPGISSRSASWLAHQCMMAKPA